MSDAFRFFWGLGSVVNVSRIVDDGEEWHRQAVRRHPLACDINLRASVFEFQRHDGKCCSSRVVSRHLAGATDCMRMGSDLNDIIRHEVYCGG